jgi:hypothetical protein
MMYTILIRSLNISKTKLNITCLVQDNYDIVYSTKKTLFNMPVVWCSVTHGVTPGNLENIFQKNHKNHNA